jgi:hypothetical protein
MVKTTIVRHFRSNLYLSFYKSRSHPGKNHCIRCLNRPNFVKKERLANDLFEKVLGQN